jgi:hypothetical protein
MMDETSVGYYHYSLRNNPEEIYFKPKIVVFLILNTY